MTHFQVRVTEISAPEISASGEAFDISEAGIGVYLPLKFSPGVCVRLSVDDSVLFGVVAHSVPERSFFRTGIEVGRAVLGRSDLAKLLQATLHRAMPALPVENSELP